MNDEDAKWGAVAALISLVAVIAVVAGIGLAIGMWWS